jgi:hypothetical protein
MTKEEEIKAIEVDLRNIFNKSYIPTFLVNKANSLIAKWKMLTGWREDPTPAFKDYLPNKETIIDKTPYYQD